MFRKFNSYSPYLDSKKRMFASSLTITRYAQAYVTKSQTAAVTVKKLYENFIVHYGFPGKTIRNLGGIFSSERIQDLCKLACVKKIEQVLTILRLMYMCERFNLTLINMLGTLEAEQKYDQKSHVASLVHVYNCNRNAATGFIPYFLLFGRKPELPIDVEFVLGISHVISPTSRSKYIEKLRRRLRFTHEKASE